MNGRENKHHNIPGEDLAGMDAHLKGRLVIVLKVDNDLCLGVRVEPF